MTEAEWLAGTDDEAIAAVVCESASDRKARLIACGCCRLAWDWLVNDGSRGAVEISELFADGLATGDELSRAAYFAEAAVFAVDEMRDRYWRDQKAVRDGWLDACDATENGIPSRDRTLISFDIARSAANWAERLNADDSRLCFREPPDPIFSPAVARDVLGNPFRSVAVDPSWLTTNVLTLAAQVYASRDFSAMPILADALQDAGCNSAEILDHCRAPGPHVRGCWVVDLLLGKT
ncbi:hypothetical protein [Gemmata palustris]|uniref:hypothetical protein n=1 Tax=Gemmata palustris TaxID=2822762 RepID=UPI0028F3E843|nr:hypothetical protein [Gemmata palustris]